MNVNQVINIYKTFPLSVSAYEFIVIRELYSGFS